MSAVPPICECQSKYLDPLSLLAFKLHIEGGKNEGAQKISVSSVLVGDIQLYIQSTGEK